MAKPVSIERAYKPVEADFWGEVFETCKITRSGQIQVEKLEETFETAESEDERVKALAAICDLKFVQNGAEQQPSQLILQKWEADELASIDLWDFLQEIGAKERPTG